MTAQSPLSLSEILVVDDDLLSREMLVHML